MLLWLVVGATPLPQAPLFGFSYPVIIAFPFGFYVHYQYAQTFWCLIRLERVPLAFAYRYVETFGVCFALYAFCSFTY